MNLPLGIQNNNPGNLRYLARRAYNGQVGENKGFGVYDTMENGIRASAKQIKKHIRNGANSIRLLITIWSPPTENDTEAYIRGVSEETGYGENELLSADNIHHIEDLCHAIFWHENGIRIDGRIIDSGVEKAFEGS